MKISKKILTTLVVAAIAVAQPAFAEVNAKFLASKTRKNIFVNKFAAKTAFREIFFRD